MTDETSPRLPPRRQSQVAPRSPVTAVTMSLCLPGLGHLYCGQVTAALAWSAGASLVGLASVLLLVSNRLLLCLLPISLLMIVAACDAFRVARSRSADYELKPWNHWLTYVLFLVVCSVGGMGQAYIIRDRFVEAFVIPTASMSPTLPPNVRVLVNKAVYRESPVQRNDVIVFANPEEPARSWVKRVVALGGEEVAILNGKLHIDGNAVESFVDGDTPDFGPIVVPRFNCFVLGDNVNQSRDSRELGPVPLATITGKVVVRYWPAYAPVD